MDMGFLFSSNLFYFYLLGKMCIYFGFIFLVICFGFVSPFFFVQWNGNACSYIFFRFIDSMLLEGSGFCVFPLAILLLCSEIKMVFVFVLWIHGPWVS